jgi:hypothetical protein
LLISSCEGSGGEARLTLFIGVLLRSTETVQRDKTAKERPAAGRQAVFGPQVVIGRYDIRDVG